MSMFTPALNLVIRRQHSVVSDEQLEAHGITRQRRRTLFANGVFDTIHRGVYILSSAEHTVEARSVAACLANPRLVICGTTAGFESVLEQLLDRRELTVPELFAADRELRKRGRDGAARFARVLAKRPAFAKPKNSDLEVRVLRALAGRGLLLVPQYEITLKDGSVIHPDGADPARRFGVEVDHVTWHGGCRVTVYDKWRDRQTILLGWQIPRVTDEDLRTRFHQTINELVELYEARAAA
jgi:hypothetical protein